MKFILYIILQLFIITAEAQTSQKVMYVCPMHPEVRSDKPGKCPKCGMNLEKKTIRIAAPKPPVKTTKPPVKTPPKKEAAPAQPKPKPQAQPVSPKPANDIKVEIEDTPAPEYTCPMHPEIKQDSPGKCPKCGMELVRKKQPGFMDHDDHEIKDT